jgi:signal transduction histidine kinase
MDFLSAATLFIVAAHIALLVYLSLYRHRAAGGAGWPGAVIILSLLASGLHLLPAAGFGTDGLAGLVRIILLVGLLAAYGGLVIHEGIIMATATNRLLWSWLGLCGLWIIALLSVALTQGRFVPGQHNWISQIVSASDLSIVVTVAGMAVVSVALLGIAFVLIYRARLPEMANRGIFWALIAAAMLVGTMLVGTAAELPALAGMILILASAAGTLYARINYRLFDMYTALIQSLRTLIFVAVTAGLVAITLYMVISLNLPTTPQGLLFMALIGALIASLLIPLHQIIGIGVRRLLMQRAPDATRATREYSQIITEMVELETLIPTIVTTLSRVMHSRASSLILLNTTHRAENSIELLMRQPGTPHDGKTGVLSVYSPIYARLAVDRRPLSQFDLEYDPYFRDVSADERQFFRDLGMSAYAPVILENTLIAVLACGAKINKTAFYPHDLDLLAIFAQQTGIALRNARLFDDLQHLNRSMRSLNQTLKGTNEKLEHMDAIKTDFVTIASHELRTPLAQVRGYTDIIDALNEQGMLDQHQTTDLVINLRKASERMEELIAAMLDVSQLDVDAMNLHVTQVTPESALRMAIEPLTDAIKQRKLAVSARGLRGLPSIQADIQRLVQAFRNVIVNAIKFTPDGGQIAIKGSLHAASSLDEVDHILVEITDTGVGIDQHNLEMIFSKFFRAYDPALHSTGTYKFMGAGPGLGLTIARGVIEAHGGRIWAESPGHDMKKCPGTSFFILLPVNTPDDARRVLSFEGSEAPSTPPNTPAVRGELQDETV